jgi:hypothetical protein
MTETRVNARLDRAAARKLAMLKRRTGLSTSEILRAALAQFDALETEKRVAVAEVLAETGFVGCGSASEDLSSDYKRTLTESLRKKT